MKDKILFNLLWSFCWIIGKLPQCVQFLLGNFVYVLLYYIVKYRRKVVRKNLTNSFPDKSIGEIKKIERKFYLQLSDIMVESLGLVSMSEKQVRERMVYENPELINGFSSEKSVIAAMAHFGSWEYTINSSLFFSAPVLAVFHPLSNEVVDKLYRKMRARFGVKPVPMTLTTREMLRSVRNNVFPVVALIADQTPPRAKIKNWIRFLNQDTPFFPGMEKIAVSFNSAVVFAHITQPKRGYYRCRFELIHDGVEKLPEDEITLRYVRKLEEMIEENPHLWMWSHRRWKTKPSQNSTILL